MKLTLKVAVTSSILQIFIRDSTSTTGAGLTGLTNASASLTAYYHRETDTTATAISLVTMTVGTFTSSGFKEVDATNMPGVYQLCPPNAAFASGAISCFIMLKGATNMAPLVIEVELVAFDPQDTVRLGLTALPNVASGSAGAIPTTGTGSNQISVSSGQVILQAGTGTGQLDFTSGVVKANATQILGTVVSTPATAGILDVNLKNIANAAVSTSSAQLGVNVVNIAGVAAAVDANNLLKVDAEDWKGGVIPAVNVTGVPKVDVVDWLGAAPNALVSGKVDAALNIRGNTAQAGAAGTITLDAGASATTDFYKGTKILIATGTGAGQARLCTAYNGSTKVASIAPNWATAPDNTSVFIIAAWAGTDAEMWLSGVIPTPNVTGVPLIDLKYTLGTISPATAGSVRADSVTGAVGSVTGTVGSVTGNVGGSVASVVGAVGSVTGNVGGSVASVVGAVGSVTGAVGSVTGSVGSVVADVGITQAGADKVWASAARTLTSFGTLVADVAAAVWAAATRTLSAFAFQPTVGGYASGQDPATLVLDVAASSHNTAGTIGAKINAAGAAGDPWTTVVPAAYSVGTAGYALGNMVPVLLKYDMATISGEANNSPLNALRALRRVAINDATGVITVYKEDGTTPAYTQQGTFDPNALPLNKID